MGSREHHYNMEMSGSTSGSLTSAPSHTHPGQALQPSMTHHSVNSGASLHYRPLQPQDYAVLKAVHTKLFPIDYEDLFYQNAVYGHDSIFSWAAIYRRHGEERLVGFVTARMVYLCECDPVDRAHLALESKRLDGESAVYVLTLGVVEGFRHMGIATRLLELVYDYAVKLGSCAIFLHVIAYNEAAMQLYQRSNYRRVACLRGFYHINSGRQPQPERQLYDAYLYAAFLPAYGVLYQQQPAPWDVLHVAVAPLRCAWGRINACMPWFCRSHLMVPQHGCMSHGEGARKHPSHQQQQQQQHAMQAMCHAMHAEQQTLLQWLFAGARLPHR